MPTYVIPDLHGRLDLLERALKAITDRGGGDVVMTGDYIDRGPQSCQIIERLILGPPRGQTWTLLSGNHEAYLVDVLADHSLLDDWLDAGGRATLLSYGWDGRGTPPVERIPPGHRRFLARLQRIARDAHRIYVHAGVDPTIPLAHQTEKRLLWDIYLDDLDIGHGDDHVVHGHEQRPEGPILLTHRTNLDVHAWKTGRLAVGVFDPDRPGGPIEILTITA
jgi:serine/threonine protein phosphatase 1